MDALRMLGRSIVSSNVKNPFKDDVYTKHSDFTNTIFKEAEQIEASARSIDISSKERELLLQQAIKKFESAKKSVDQFNIKYLKDRSSLKEALVKSLMAKQDIPIFIAQRFGGDIEKVQDFIVVWDSLRNSQGERVVIKQSAQNLVERIVNVLFKEHNEKLDTDAVNVAHRLHSLREELKRMELEAREVEEGRLAEAGLARQRELFEVPLRKFVQDFIGEARGVIEASKKEIEEKLSDLDSLSPSEKLEHLRSARDIMNRSRDSIDSLRAAGSMSAKEKFRGILESMLQNGDNLPAGVFTDEGSKFEQWKSTVDRSDAQLRKKSELVQFIRRNLFFSTIEEGKRYTAEYVESLFQYSENWWNDLPFLPGKKEEFEIKWDEFIQNEQSILNDAKELMLGLADSAFSAQGFDKTFEQLGNYFVIEKAHKGEIKYSNIEVQIQQAQASLLKEVILKLVNSENLREISQKFNLMSTYEESFVSAK